LEPIHAQELKQPLYQTMCSCHTFTLVLFLMHCSLSEVTVPDYHKCPLLSFYLPLVLRKQWDSVILLPCTNYFCGFCGNLMTMGGRGNLACKILLGRRSQVLFLVLSLIKHMTSRSPLKLSKPQPKQSNCSGCNLHKVLSTVPDKE
jgi:hypothetical protein